MVGFETAVDACPSGNHDLISDNEMVCQPCLSTDHDVMPHASTAGDPDLCDEDGMGSDRHVMGDLDEIVDFAALLDDSLAKCGSIDCDIRPKLDIILDRDSAELGNFVMPSLVLYIAESVAPDHRATVNDDPCADGTAFSHNDIRIQQRIVSDVRIAANEHTGIECHPCANRDPISQSDSRPDRDIRSDLGIMATDHGCVDSAGRGDGAKEGAGDLRKGQCGIRDDDVGIGDFRQTSVSKEYSCAGGPACFEYPISGDEGQIVRACLFKASQVCNRNVW